MTDTRRRRAPPTLRATSSTPSPSGRWSAPGRVNLIGEHTDYNDGFVLPFAIDRRTTVTVGRARRPPAARRQHLRRAACTRSSLDALDPRRIDGWSAYVVRHRLGAAQTLPEVDGARRAAAPTSPRRSGLDIFVDSDVPVGAGLSSSAAHRVRRRRRPRPTSGSSTSTARPSPRVGQLAENDAVGAPTGIMDQSASLLGRADSAVFLDCRSLDAEVIDLGFDAGRPRAARHRHARRARARHRRLRRAPRLVRAGRRGSSASRRCATSTSTTCPRAAELLDDETFRRVRHVVTENQRVLDTVRTLRTEGPARDRRPARRLARVDARRLRDLGARARPRRRDRAGAPAPSARG